MKIIVKAFLLLLVLTGTTALAQAEIRKERVKFKPGEIGATVKGQIKGDASVDYLVRARAGQSLTVVLTSKNSANYFNVMAPGEESAMFIGSTSGNRFVGQLPKDGDYTIRVYLMRSAARRGEKAAYQLDVTIAGDNPAAGSTKKDASGSVDDDALSDAITRAGEGKFNATGQIPCAQHVGQPMGQCKFGVARAGGGTAAVVVSLPDGRKRTIFFKKGEAISADLSQADGDMTFRVTKEADLYQIKAGKERYEIPEAVIYGG